MALPSRQSLLDNLRSKTVVDCDTLDASIAHDLGPFQDCTSNQAIAYLELLHTRHEELIKQSVALAKELHQRYPIVRIDNLAVEVCMVKLALLILPHLEGRVHIQVNPFDAYSTHRTVTGAQRIIEIFKHCHPALSAKDRVCIKIPSTWEGLQACRTLERDHGISTLATTLFSLEQAAVAAEAGCLYIAPYINELAVHFDQGYSDPSPNHAVCVQAQFYFDKHGYKRTATLPASLTSMAECMSLARVRHMTIAPTLLHSLATANMVEGEEGSKAFASLFEDEEYIARIVSQIPDQPLNLLDDEEGFRRLFTLRDGGAQEIKQIKAINIFANFQLKMVAMIQKLLS